MSGVVVVESPAKARTINKYLGSNYQVVASYGHVRDLPPRDKSVRPEQDFTMVWEEKDNAARNIAAIASAIAAGRKGALYLATDPDREGEAISWHILSSLKERNLLDGVSIHRVVFHEITPEAIRRAMDNPRTINEDLVQAYFARRALDYLVGFTLSPLLWRKIPGSRSAGRVQSVALRLLCEREGEIERFKPQEYWRLDAMLASLRGERFAARLASFDGRKLGPYDLNRKDAERARALLLKAALAIKEVTQRKTARRPRPPFTTSTLQQEASRKLGFAARRTMRLAQQLYEGIDAGQGRAGLITYMRTDSTVLAGQAVAALRSLISRQFGAPYLPSQPRAYAAKAKNAQEAHEAIRPTDASRQPRSLAAFLDADQAKLYDLIWKRAVACQMSDAVIEQASADIEALADDGRAMLRASGSRIVFDGFLKLYEESVDDKNDEKSGGGDDAFLPLLKKGESARLLKAEASQHFTKPPPRYSEASLVKKMEELGIGRPSTYASIIGVLQERGYARLEKRRFVTEDRGRVVTSFLENFFARYVEYDFTASMEDNLDHVSRGQAFWKDVLRAFWTEFNGAVEKADRLSMREVIDALNEALAPCLFGEDVAAGRRCPQCEEGALSLKLSRYGGFLGCSRYPQCRYTRPLPWSGDKSGAARGGSAARILGQHPLSGDVISLRLGPYGHYLQMDAAPGKTETGKAEKARAAGAKAQAAKPKRASLPKGRDPDSIALAEAVKWLELPRKVTTHPQSGDDIVAGIGPYGPYVRHQRLYASLEEGDDVLSIGANRAIALLTAAEEKRRARGERELGKHPVDRQPVTLRRGRFGYYVEHGALRAAIGKGEDAKALNLEQALALLAKRAAAGKRAGRAAGGKAKTASGAKKPATKKAATRKATTKKAAAEKAEKPSRRQSEAERPGAGGAS